MTEFHPTGSSHEAIRMIGESARLTWMQSLPKGQLCLFLMEFSHALTVAARLLASEVPTDNAIRHLRELNELQHLILQILIRLHRGNEYQAWLNVLAGQLITSTDELRQHQIGMAWSAARESAFSE